MRFLCIPVMSLLIPNQGGKILHYLSRFVYYWVILMYFKMIIIVSTFGYACLGYGKF